MQKNVLFVLMVKLFLSLIWKLLVDFEASKLSQLDHFLVLLSI